MMKKGGEHRFWLNIKVGEWPTDGGQGHCPTLPDLPLSDDDHYDHEEDVKNDHDEDVNDDHDDEVLREASTCQIR